MTGRLTLDGELELEEITDADGDRTWRIVDENGTRRKLILGEAEARELSVTDGDGPLTISRQSDGSVATEGHADIQAAIDALEEDRGMVFVVAKGDKDDDPDAEKGGYEVTSTINISATGESRVVGTGISTRIHGTLSNAILKNSTEDTEIAWFWIDQFGAGNTVRIDGNCHVHDINIDETGNIALVDTTAQDFSNLGPYIEIKAGPTAAIQTNGNSIVHGNNLVKNSDTKTMERAIWADGSPTILSNNWIRQDGSSGDKFGLQASGGSGLTVLGPHYVGAAPDNTRFITGAVGPSVAAYEIRSSNVIGNGLVEDGTCGTGVRVFSDVSDVSLSGHFPSGLEFGADVTSPAEVVINGRVGSIDEATAGYGAGQVVNGRSWVTTALGNGSIWDGQQALAHRLGITIEDRSTNPPYDHYVADSSGEWVEKTVQNVAAGGHSTAEQSIPSGTETVVEIDTTAFEDDPNVADVDTANDQITAGRDGVYQIKGGVRWVDNIGGGDTIATRISVNSSTVAGDKTVLGGTDTPAQTVTKTTRLTAGDDVSFSVYQDVGSSKNVSGDERTFLSTTLLG